ncbi:hypothetical protein T492DRAFT_913729, partial [Pavlovales sp. CCMP2436]
MRVSASGVGGGGALAASEGGAVAAQWPSAESKLEAEGALRLLHGARPLDAASAAALSLELAQERARTLHLDAALDVAKGAREMASSLLALQGEAAARRAQGASDALRAARALHAGQVRTLSAQLDGANSAAIELERTARLLHAERRALALSLADADAEAVVARAAALSRGGPERGGAHAPAAALPPAPPAWARALAERAAAAERERDAALVAARAAPARGHGAVAVLSDMVGRGEPLSAELAAMRRELGVRTAHVFEVEAALLEAEQRAAASQAAAQDLVEARAREALRVGSGGASARAAGAGSVASLQPDDHDAELDALRAQLLTQSLAHGEERARADAEAAAKVRSARLDADRLGRDSAAHGGRAARDSAQHTAAASQPTGASDVCAADALQRATARLHGELALAHAQLDAVWATADSHERALRVLRADLAALVQVESGARSESLAQKLVRARLHAAEANGRLAAAAHAESKLRLRALSRTRPELPGSAERPDSALGRAEAAEAVAEHLRAELAKLRAELARLRAATDALSGDEDAGLAEGGRPSGGGEASVRSSRACPSFVRGGYTPAGQAQLLEIDRLRHALERARARRFAKQPPARDGRGDDGDGGHASASDSEAEAEAVLRERGLLERSDADGANVRTLIGALRHMQRALTDVRPAASPREHSRIARSVSGFADTRSRVASLGAPGVPGRADERRAPGDGDGSDAAEAQVGAETERLRRALRHAEQMGAHEMASLRQIHEIELGAVTQRYELVADAHRTLSSRHAQLRAELQQLQTLQAAEGRDELLADADANIERAARRASGFGVQWALADRRPSQQRTERVPAEEREATAALVLSNARLKEAVTLATEELALARADVDAAHAESGAARADAEVAEAAAAVLRLQLAAAEAAREAATVSAAPAQPTSPTDAQADEVAQHARDAFAEQLRDARAELDIEHARAAAAASAETLESAAERAAAVQEAASLRAQVQASRSEVQAAHARLAEAEGAARALATAVADQQSAPTQARGVNTEHAAAEGVLLKEAQRAREAKDTRSHLLLRCESLEAALAEADAAVSLSEAEQASAQQRAHS